MVTTVIDDCRHRHGRRGESLYLLQFETHVFGLCGKIGHVFDLTCRMIGDEIRNELQVQLLFDIDLIKTLLELVKVGEGRFPHQAKDRIRGVLRGHLESP